MLGHAGGLAVWVGFLPACACQLLEQRAVHVAASQHTPMPPVAAAAAQFLLSAGPFTGHKGELLMDHKDDAVRCGVEGAMCVQGP